MTHCGEVDCLVQYLHNPDRPMQHETVADNVDRRCTSMSTQTGLRSLANLGKSGRKPLKPVHFHTKFHSHLCYPHISSTHIFFTTTCLPSVISQGRRLSLAFASVNCDKITTKKVGFYFISEVMHICPALKSILQFYISIHLTSVPGTMVHRPFPSQEGGSIAG